MSTADDIARTDTAVQAVADALPFAVTSEADMGGTWALQINLGSQFEGEDNPFDRAGIEIPEHWQDAGEEGDPVWWFEAREGEVYEASEFTIDADPTQVAAWVAALARKHGSPAAR